MTDPPEDPDAAAERLYDHLSATAELPVERTASRLLGEAEAVADDMQDCAPAVMADRAGVVVELLDAIDDTGDETAQHHVETARSIASTLAAIDG